MKVFQKRFYLFVETKKVSSKKSYSKPPIFIPFLFLIKRIAAFAVNRDTCGFSSGWQRKKDESLLGKILSSFISSSFQNVSAAFRRHSLSESVYFASLSLFGLIRSFHCLFSLQDHCYRYFYSFFSFPS